MEKINLKESINLIKELNKENIVKNELIKYIKSKEHNKIYEQLIKILKRDNLNNLVSLLEIIDKKYYIDIENKVNSILKN